MLPIVNLIVALVVSPGYLLVTKENEQYKVAKGSNPAMLAAFDIMQSLNINSTYKAANDFYGYYINGTYTGLLKQLVMEEFDIIFYPFTPIVKNGAFSISPVIDEWEHAIHSISRPAVKNDIYVITQLGNIGISNWTLLILSAMFCILFLRSLQIPLSVFDAIAMFLKQNYREITKLKLLLVLLIFSFAITIDLITSAFSTQLVVVDLPDFAENLRDIDQQKLTLYMYKDLGTHEEINKRDTHILSKIDAVVLSITEASDVLDTVIKRMSQSKAAVVGPRFMRNMAAQMLCSSADGNYAKCVENNQALHASMSIATSFASFPIRNNLSSLVMDRIKLLCYSFIDYGLFNGLKYTLLDYFAYVYGDYKLCAEKLLDLRRQPADQYKDIKLFNFTCTFLLLLTSILINAIVLFLELFMGKYWK